MRTADVWLSLGSCIHLAFLVWGERKNNFRISVALTYGEEDLKKKILEKKILELLCEGRMMTRE